MRGRHAGSSRLPHCLSPAGKCQFHSGIPESDGRDVIVGVQIEASGRVGQPSLIRTDGLEGAVLGGGMTRCTGRKRSPLAFGHADVSVVVRRVSTTTLGLTELRHQQAEGGVISCQHPGNPR